MALMETAAVLSIASGVLGFSSGRRAKRAARRAAAEQARIEAMVTGERIRQIYQSERTLSGETIARAAGSGIVTTQGSPLMILAEQAYEFERERRFTKQVGASRANAALAEGRSIGRQYQAQGLQNLFAGLGQAASMMVKG